MRGAAAGLLAAALFTAACGSSADTGSDATSKVAGSASGAGASSDAVALVKQRLAKPGAYQLDAPKIDGVAALKGKTVLYVPISLQIPLFQSVLKGMQEAAGHAGVTVSGCDAKISPAGAAACVNQAIAQHVGAVVLDNVALELIGQGAQQLKDAGIPVLQAEQFAQPGTKEMAYLETGGPAMIAAQADWIAVDSGGKANVLVVAQMDGNAQRKYLEEVLVPEFKKACPGCTTTELTLSSTQLQNLPSQIGTALLKDPSISYVASMFDTAAPLIATGLKNSPNGSKVKLTGAIGDSASLQRVAAGQQAFSTLVSPRFQGWAITDQVLRQISGMQPLEKVDAPWRAFDKSNIGGVKADQSGIDDESLWGGDNYSAEYLKLWGVS